MLSRIAFYPTLLYNVVLERVTGREWYNRIDQTVLLGALPFRSIMPELQKCGVKGVVTLNEPFELQHFVPTTEEFESLGIQQLVLSTPDLTAAPTQEKLNKGVEFIHGFRNTGDSVYVHCKAGRTRSTTLVACYLMSLWTAFEVTLKSHAYNDMENSVLVVFEGYELKKALTRYTIGILNKPFSILRRNVLIYGLGKPRSTL